MNTNEKASRDVLKSKRFLTLLFTTLMVFINALLQEHAGFALSENTTELLIGLAILVVGSYGFQDIIGAWKKHGLDGILEALQDTLAEAVQELNEKMDQKLPGG